MHNSTPLITTIVGGLVLAFLLGMLANRLRISPLVGYLAAGVLAGPFTPGFVADTSLAPELAEIGVILLMFGVGLHFSLKDLLAVKSIAIPGAVAQIAVATLLGMGLSKLLGWDLISGLVFGLCLSTASTVVLLRALEERQLIDSQRGQIAIGWLIVEDLAMVLTLVLLPAFGNMLGNNNASSGQLLMELALTIGKVIAFIALMIVVGRRLVPWILSKTASTGSRELFTLAVLALALGIAYGAVKLFDVSFALGAFFAGMVLNESELSHRAAHDTLPLRDAFAVLFFVSVGMLFDPMIVINEPLAVLATLAIIVFGKSAAAFLLVKMFGHSKRTALTISASLAQIGEFADGQSAIPVGEPRLFPGRQQQQCQLLRRDLVHARQPGTVHLTVRAGLDALALHKLADRLQAGGPIPLTLRLAAHRFGQYLTVTVIGHFQEGDDQAGERRRVFLRQQLCAGRRHPLFSITVQGNAVRAQGILQ